MQKLEKEWITRIKEHRDPFTGALLDDGPRPCEKCVDFALYDNDSAVCQRCVEDAE